MKTKHLIIAAAMVVFATTASAQTTDENREFQGRGRAAGNAWTDANNNGICDHFEVGTRMGRRPYSAGENLTTGERGPGRGSGLARNMAAGWGRGILMAPGRGSWGGQTMAPGRGIWGGQTMAPGRGEGRMMGTPPGRGRFNGRGPAFVDANNNGICDYLEAAIEDN